MFDLLLPHIPGTAPGLMRIPRLRRLVKAVIPLAGVLAVALLEGCANPGGVKTMSTLREASTVASDAALKEVSHLSAAWPKENWWQRYGDAQLDSMMEEAFRESPSLRIAEARIRHAQAAAGVAEAAISPQVNGNMKSQRQQYSANSIVPKPLAGNWAWLNEGTVNLGYELDFWGKNRAAVEGAIGRVKASEAESHAARMILAVGVARTYLHLAQCYEQLDLAEAVLKTRRGILSITRQRVDGKLDSALELKQAELAIPVALEQTAQLKENIALTRNQLAALLGQGPDRGLQISRPHLSHVAREGVPANVTAELIGRRPDVVALRWRVEAAHRDIDVAKAQFYPNINLAAFIGFQSLGFDRFLNGGSRVAGIGPALSLPIFDGGRLRGNLAVRDAEYDIAVELYNRTLIDAVHDVVNQLTSMHWLQDRLLYQKQALDASQDAYELAVSRYRSGLSNYLQVLIAEGQVHGQRRAQIDLNARALELDINLVRALGGGYQSPDSDARIKSAHLSRNDHE